MLNKISIFCKMIVLVGMISLMAIGCVPKEPKPVEVCIIPSGYNIAEAFQTARNTLSNYECRYKFDVVFDALLGVCEGDPSIKNKELFSDFLLWVKDQGIISNMQAKEYYNRYFSTRFTSLPQDYQTCSYCREIRSIMSKCLDELKDKERGLLKVCNDKASFTKASEDLQKMELIFEATCSACSAE